MPGTYRLSSDSILRAFALPVLVAGALLVAAPPRPARAASDAKAVALAESVMEHMGGREAWDATRYIHWRFFAGPRLHTWDRATGDIRIEAGDRLVLMNLWSKKGRVWDGGTPLEGDALREALDTAYAWWVNDSYWLLMPYKLLDPGVTLRYGGDSTMEDGRAADLITLTFDPGIGLTPQNTYDVWIARDSGLVEQWSYYADAADAEPKFTLPWHAWKRFGKIMLATERGKNSDWQIAVYDELPRSVFETP